MGRCKLLEGMQGPDAIPAAYASSQAEAGKVGKAGKSRNRHLLVTSREGEALMAPAVLQEFSTKGKKLEKRGNVGRKALHFYWHCFT
jgi:hypothetical protein